MCPRGILSNFVNIMHMQSVLPSFLCQISKINPWNFHILFQIKLATQWYAFCYFFPMKLFFFLNFMLYSQNFWKCREQENISSNFHLVGLNGKSLCHDVTFIYRDGRSPSFDFMLSYYNGESPSHDGNYERKISWIVKRIGKYSENCEMLWKIWMKCEMIWKIWKKIVKRYGNYGRKASRIVKRFGKYGRKASWIVKWHGKYGRFLC